MTRAHYGVAALMSIVVGWFVFDAVASLVAFPVALASQGDEPSLALWALLWAGVLLPVLLFAAAIVVARRQPLPRFALVIIVALTTTAALRISIIALAAGSTAL
jgi:hypothetical protein